MWVKVQLRHDIQYGSKSIGPDCTWEFHDNDAGTTPGIIHFFYDGKIYSIRGFREDGNKTLYGFLIDNGINALYENRKDHSWPEGLSPCWVNLEDMENGWTSPRIHLGWNNPNLPPKAVTEVDKEAYKLIKEFGMF